MTPPQSSLDGLFSNPDILEASLLLEGNKIDHQFLARLRPTHDNEFWNLANYFISELRFTQELREIILVFPKTQLLFIPLDAYLLIVTTTREIALSLCVTFAKNWLQSYYHSKNPSPFEDLTPSRGINSPAVEAPPDPIQWKNFRDKMESLLSKVLSFSVCGQLIEQCCRELDLNVQKGISPTRFQELGLYIIAKVPNSSKQKSLIADFEEIMKNPTS